MRLSAPVALLSLLAAGELSPFASAFRQDAKLRILKRIEAGGMPRPSPPGAARVLNNKGGNKDKDGGGGGNNKSGGSGRADKHGLHSNGRGGNPHKTHSAHLDDNTNGIATDAVEYEYGTPIAVSFDLVNENVSDEALALLDVDRMSEWTVGVFMRMARPQGGSLAPIIAATPTITENGARMLQERKRGGLRKLQGNGNGGGNGNGNGGGNSGPSTTVPPPPATEAPPEATATEPPPEPVVLPTLDSTGAATLEATDPDTLRRTEYGTGFDVYLLDQDGSAILGPATFYMTPTPGMEEADEANKGKKADHPLVQFDHGSKFKNKGGAKGKGGGKGGGKGKGPAKGNVGKPFDPDTIGRGTGMDGGMIIGTAEALGNYELATDKDFYATGEDVVVTYDLSPEAVEGRRFLQKNGGGNGKKDATTAATEAPATEAPATSEAPKGNKGNGGGNDKGTDPTAPASTTTDAPDMSSTTIAATTTEPTIDMGSGTEGETGAAEGPPEVDRDDVTLFRVGVYMRMARPQAGALLPIASVPFCESPDACNPDELGMGEFTVSTDGLDVAKNGNGFDVWILNGLGEGIAGPHTFYVDV